MKTIELEEITPGTIAESDYYSDKGELLISRGKTITQKYLDILSRRNLFTLYIPPEDEYEEVQALLAKDFSLHSNFEFEERPKALETPELKDVMPGKDGLSQLKSSSITLDLDKRIGDRSVPDRPVGPALKDDVTQMDVTERTQEYKQQIFDMYKKALEETKRIFTVLAEGKRVTSKEIRSISERFVNVFVTDADILINIAGIKPLEEDYLYNHSLNVCLLSISIAASSGYNKNQVIVIGMGALLHDIGMLLIPKRIRLMKSKLSEEDWYEVQKHPILGLHLLEKIKELPDAVPYIAYQTHERENGRGYPKKRSSQLIHRFAKLVQVADVYEALSSPRAYREPSIPYQAVEKIIKMTKTGLISDEFVKSFLGYISLFPVGSLVELSDKRIAKVISGNRTSFSKPVVSILADSEGRILNKNEICQVDLHEDTHIQIIKALSNDYLQNISLMDGF